jgi:hypothetical protein
MDELVKSIEPKKKKKKKRRRKRRRSVLELNLEIRIKGEWQVQEEDFVLPRNSQYARA